MPLAAIPYKHPTEENEGQTFGRGESPQGKVVGELFNVLGEPIDELGPVKSDEHWPIHRPAPSFEERETTPQILETGVKVLDPFA